MSGFVWVLCGFARHGVCGLCCAMFGVCFGDIVCILSEWILIHVQMSNIMPI